MQYGLIGERLGHSFSKDIHGMIDNYEYELKEIPKGELDAFMKAKDFRGINVTIPYKQDVIPYLDEISDIARRIGAVNCIVNRDGRLLGHNTDYDGLKALILRNNIDMKGKKVLILGTGGTSRTATVVVEDLLAGNIIHVSRKAGDGCIDYEDAVKNHSDADVILNTTPVGMYPNSFGCPIDISKFGNLSGVIDVIFNPLRTELVLNALDRNIPAEGGLYMLVVQAIKAAERFHNKTYDIAIADNIFRTLASKKENLVLVGMPGSGKSTIARVLSKSDYSEVLDTDTLIVKRENREISDIFSSEGEKYFRDIESEVVKELSDKTGLLIATGGGTILRAENVHNLKRNGRIFFLDRPLKNLLPTSDRPLANSAEKITALYEQRYPIYTACADVIIDSSGDVDSVISQIRRIQFGE